MRVVIVDDSETFRKAVCAYLSRWDRLQVAGCAATGIEGVALVETTSPDLVLMDLMMPEMDGLAATQEIRRRGIDAKVMMVTMFEDAAFAEYALAAGADAFVTKGDFHEGFEKHVMSWFGMSTSDFTTA